MESTVAATSQDFGIHSMLCHELLEHYSAQWRDREVYWRARERSAAIGDLLTLIIDSFDRSKLYLPKFPFNRTPKRPAYQAYNRSLAANCLFFFFEKCLTCMALDCRFYLSIYGLSSSCQGASLVLTAVLAHGHGCWMYLSPGEGIGCGSSWQWECASWF